MSLDSMTEAVRAKVGENSGLDATVKFVIDEGIIFLDATASPNRVSNEDGEAECTITMSNDDFEALMAGDLNPTMAFMTGKLKITGNMAVAMDIGKVL